MKDTNLKIISELKIFIANASKNKERYCSKQSDFTRDRVLTFSVVCFCLINMMKRSMGIELDSFFETQRIDDDCTKGAFSQARYKLKHEFFIDWNYEFTKLYYTENAHNIKTWKGHRVLGVDGSTLYLFNKKEMIDYFGTQNNQSTSIPMARVMLCHDVLNKISIHSEVMPIKNGELETAKKWFDLYEKNDLGIYDRGFASFELAYLSLKKKHNFVMRYPVSFNNEVKAFVKSGEMDQIIEFTATTTAIQNLSKLGYTVNKETRIKLRLLRIILDTGEVEVLVTNLFDKQEYPYSCFKELYWLRWGVETQFDVLKNNMQLEIISGHKVEAVKQDFYAMVFTANINSLLVNSCEPELKKTTKQREHDYSINYNIAIGLLKNKIIRLFLDENPEVIIEKFQKKILKNLVAKGKCKQKDRKAKTKRLKGKYQTYTNYRRAV